MKTEKNKQGMGTRKKMPSLLKRKLRMKKSLRVLFGGVGKQYSMMRRIILICLALLLVLLGIVLVRNSNTSSDRLEKQLSRFEYFIEKRDAHNTTISKADVAWHVDHCLKTINRIYERLEASDPQEYKANFSLSRTLIYTWGDFPRGVAESPKVVRPPDNISTDSLYLQLEAARKNIKKLKELPAKAHFKHPNFKLLNRNQSQRFLEIHTEHHLKIIRDILKN